MKLPGKDTVTVPWMSRREIPAIKAVLSAWRKLRKDKDLVKTMHDIISLCENLDAYAKTNMEIAAWALEKLAATDERLRKEASK